MSRQSPVTPLDFSRMTLTNFPADILLEIIEWILTDTPTDARTNVKSLSLTSRALHALAVPVLYRSLTFDLNMRRHDAEAHGGVDLNLKLKRANSLLHAPHLLENVRELRFCGWSFPNFRFIPRPDGVLDKPTMEHMLHANLETVALLISSMPTLQHAELTNCPMAPPLHRSLFASPRLNSLIIGPGAVGFSFPEELPADTSETRHIRHLEYRNTWSVPSSWDMVFKRMLKHCSLALQSLAIDITYLPYVARWASDRNLSLRTLTVSAKNPWDEDQMSQVAEFLLLCPELRALTINETLEESVSLRLRSDAIPNLETISVPCELVPMFTDRRPVRKIVVAFGSDMGSVKKFLSHTKTHLRELYASLNLTSLTGLLRFLAALNHFPNLTILAVEVDAIGGAHHWVEMTVEKQLNAFGLALGPLMHLEICEITSNLRLLPDIEDICPAAHDRDLSTRGHASLREIVVDCLDKNRWIWVHRQGWVRTALNCPTRFASQSMELRN